jgi:hypothetical protein
LPWRHATEAGLARFLDMRKKLLLRCAVALCALGSIPSARALEGNAIVYNRQGDEVGVIQGTAPNGDRLMLPTNGVLDLGYYDVSVPAGALRPRPAGGWEILLDNQQIAFLPPVPHRFFQPSGD